MSEMGQKQKSRSAKGTSGLPSKADIIAEAKEVRFGPIPDLSRPEQVVYPFQQPLGCHRLSVDRTPTTRSAP